MAEENRQRALREAEKRKLGAIIGISDEHLLAELLEAGFTADTVPLLYLIPALEVAWVDGSPSDSEHARMLELARLEGVERGSPAYEKLLGWLKDKPPAEFFASTLRLIGQVCGLQSPADGDATVRKVLSHCSQIAEASGGWLGLSSKVSGPEAQILDRIAKQLEMCKGNAKE